MSPPPESSRKASAIGRNSNPAAGESPELPVEGGRGAVVAGAGGAVATGVAAAVGLAVGAGVGVATGRVWVIGVSGALQNVQIFSFEVGR